MKKVFIAIICILLVVAGILVVGIFNLGPIIKTAVNTYGPEVVKTGVGVDDVDVSVFTAQAQLKNFILENPQGFATSEAVSVGSIFMDGDESSLTTDTIVIDRIEVDSPEITYEIKGKTDNFRTIMERMKGPAAPEKPPEKAPGEKATPEKKGKNLLIKDFIIRGGKVNMVVSGFAPGFKGKMVTATLPEIHLQNIGQGEKEASPKAVFMKVFEEVYGKITSPDLTEAFSDQLKALGISFEGLDVTRQQINEAADNLKDVKTEIKDAGEKLKGLFH